jgi:hypothetical protein
MREGYHSGSGLINIQCTLFGCEVNPLAGAVELMLKRLLRESFVILAICKDVHYANI